MQRAELQGQKSLIFSPLALNFLSIAIKLLTYMFSDTFRRKVGTERWKA